MSDRIAVQPMFAGLPIAISRDGDLVDICIGNESDSRGVIFDCGNPETVRMALDVINTLSRLVSEARSFASMKERSAKAGRPVSAG